MAKNLQFVDANGQFQHDILKKKVGIVTGNQELADKLDGECAIKKDSPEDSVFEAIKCYHSKTGEPFMII